jgi:group I intron endonuclease
MPYAASIIGIYKITNLATKTAYIGQSTNVQKRIQEHFRLLGLGKHINPHFQRAYNKYGRDAFTWSLEIECATAKDLDDLENAFLQDRAHFDEERLYNVASEAKVPMRGRRHTEATKQRISAQKIGKRDHSTPEWRAKLCAAQKDRAFRNKEFVARLKFIVDNPEMSYAERGRAVKRDTTTVRKLALKYAHLKGAL